MLIVARIVMGILLVAHGLVHLLYLISDVPEFSLNRSWLIPESARRSFGVGTALATVTMFALLALAVWGVPGLTSLWPVLTVVACLLSALLLIVYWDRWLAFGVAIDVALLILAVTRPDWLQHLVTGEA